MSKYNKPILISRRHFLRTTTGGLVAIPLLQSLLPVSKAFGAPVAPKRFLGIVTNNGYHPAFMYPEYTRISTTKIQANGLDAHVMPLANLSGPISHIIGTEFDTLKSSMMLLRGFEGLSPTSDHNGQFAFSGMIGAALPNVGSRYPSIDQHIKNVVYGTNIPALDVLNISISWDGARSSKSFKINPTTGALEYTRNFYEPSAVWQQLFGTSGGGNNDLAKDQLVADKVVKHYRAVSANPMLSLADKKKLDDHLARVTDRQRTLTTVIGCNPPLKPTVVFNQNAATARQAIAAMIDLIVAAFECDITRVVIFEIDPDALYRTLDPYRTGYHDVSHFDTGPGDVTKFADISKEQFGYIANLWQKLKNSTDVDGNSILYNTLSLVTKEIGDYGGAVRTGNPANDRVRYAGTLASPNLDNNHLFRSMFAMVGGNLGGILKPGKYIDYTSDIYSPNTRWKPLLGPSYGELLISTLVAFGVQPTAWEIGSTRGYGDNRNALYDVATPASVPKSLDKRSLLPGWNT